MPDFDLSRQVGPLPLGVWMLAVGGGLAVSYVVNRRAGSADPAPVPDDPMAGTGLVRSPANRGLFVFDDANEQPSGVKAPAAPDAAGTNAITDNYGWERAAISLHVGRGADGTIVQDAISRYLAGEPVTLAMRVLVAEAIRVLGPPPQPVPPMRAAAEVNKPNPSAPKAPTPKPTPGATPTRAPRPAGRGKRYTIVSGDTLWRIARRNYGNGALWPRIWRANAPMRSGNPNLIFPGERIIIPR